MKSGCEEMDIRQVFVVGAGQMGCGIAQVVVQAGLDVILFDVNGEQLQKGLQEIEKNLLRQVQKNRMTYEEMMTVTSRIHHSMKLKDAKESDMVIEAALEKIQVKQQIFSQLDAIVRNDVVLASNTSSLPITEIAAATNHPERVIGMHFSNPVPVMDLVEVIRGLATSDKVYEVTHQLAEKLGKCPIEVRDSPGFVTNRVLITMINEAIYTVYEGIAKPADVDQVMKLGMNHPMGPLELADLIGLDTCLSIMETLHDGFRDSKYRPCPLLRKYVSAGWLGRKTGKGFYVYD